MTETESIQMRGGDGDAARAYATISGLYLLVFYGFGALYPLLSQYYKAIGLSGTEIGTISAIAPVVAIVAQPVWGIVCDRYQARKRVLALTLAASAVVALFFPLTASYAWVLALFALLSVFQSAVNPIADSIALSFAKKHHTSYGSLRMWGAVGFAVATFFTGLAVEQWGATSLFYCYAAAFILALPLMRRIPDEGAQFTTSIFKGLGELLRLPRFVLFLIGAFFIFGAINANNIYFSLYYRHIGGSVAGIGLAFLLFAGSEAPFMKAASFFIRRWGLEMTILLAGAVSAARWFWYSSAPGTTTVLAMFFIQGLSVGFYLASAAQYVRENTPSSLQVTALAVFSSIGQGLGTMTCNLLAGVIMDKAGILHTYTFFGAATLIGLIPLLLIRFGPFRKPAGE